MLMSVNTTIHDMSLKCFDDDYVIVHFLYCFWQNKVPWKIIWKVSYRCKFPALGPQRTAKFIIRKHMFQNSLHVYVQIAVAHWTAWNSREWHHPVSWERTPSIWSQMPGEVHELQPWLGILFRMFSESDAAISQLYMRNLGGRKKPPQKNCTQQRPTLSYLTTSTVTVVLAPLNWPSLRPQNN